MKHHTEPLHHSLHTSLRANERPMDQEGDAIPGKRDMRHEQHAAFQKPGDIDHRVAQSEKNQGRLD